MTQNIALLVEDREAALLGQLPPAARERFRALLQDRDDRHALLLAAGEAARDAREDLRFAERDLDQTMRAVNRDERAEESVKRRIAASRVEISRRARRLEHF